MTGSRPRPDPVDLWIDGAPRAATGRAVVELIEPATGEPFSASADASPDDVAAAVDAAHAALDRSRWADAHPYERGTVLRELARLVRRDAASLALLESQNNGQPVVESRRQVDSTAVLLDYYGGLAPTVHGESPIVGDGVLDLTRLQPYGVCGLILAFNAPLHILAMKAAPALATGNAVVAKPSPYTPLTAVRFAELAAEAGLPDGLLNVTPSTRLDSSRALASSPLVPKLSFTGSSATGAQILADAAPHIKSVTLELGGKSASIVCEDADLDLMIDSSVYAATFRGSGQICTHRTRVYVARSRFVEVVDRFAAAASELAVGDPLDPATTVGPLVSEAQRERVDGLVRRALDAGARAATGGRRLELSALPGGAFYAPTVLVEVANDAEVVQEEVFGPVVCIMPFDDEAEALQLANDSRYGLAGSIWAGDVGRAIALSQRFETGNVSINQAPVIYPWAPFSGHGHSGLGVEMGAAALREYVKLQNVMVRL